MDQLEQARRQARLDRGLVAFAIACAPVFEHFGWKYSRQNGEMYIPDAAALAGTLLMLWHDTKPGEKASTGRFQVWRPRDADAVVSLQYHIETATEEGA